MQRYIGCLHEISKIWLVGRKNRLDTDFSSCTEADPVLECKTL